MERETKAAFTAEDVRRIERVLHDLEARYDDASGYEYMDGALYDEMEKWTDLADRIAALLPPREEATDADHE